MNHLSANMHACIKDCLRCHATCFGVTTSHCLEAGGEHVEPGHSRLMLACAEICENRARSREEVGDTEECVKQCRACVGSCRGAPLFHGNPQRLRCRLNNSATFLT